MVQSFVIALKKAVRLKAFLRRTHQWLCCDNGKELGLSGRKAFSEMCCNKSFPAAEISLHLLALQVHRPTGITVGSF